MHIEPFCEGDSFATFRSITANAIAEIDALENDYVLKASVSELEQHYVAKVTLTPLSLDADNHYIEDQKGTALDVSHDFHRARWGNERIVVKGTILSIAIPFTGDQFLWRVRPSTYSLSGYPQIDVRGGVVIFKCTFADDSANAEQLKGEVRRAIGSLAKAVGDLASDVSRHNVEAPREVRSALERKLSRARSAIGAVTSLGIPIKAKSVPATFVVPTKRREIPVSRPTVSKETFSPEPTLDQREFENILKILKSMALVIERSPTAFASLDEEAIRTHFLLQLNGHYEGAATGETFNSAGKTDILIRVDNKNVFIAECKFWRGATAFSGAIDQLLGYLSWRDSKCAILVFNRTQNSTAVRRKMHETMAARAEHRKTVAHDECGDSRYVFVKPSDPGREIQIHTMLFDIPPRAA